MRRDEIRIFPGNVETHIHRIKSFPDPSISPAEVSPPSSQNVRPVLEYHEYREPRFGRCAGLLSTILGAVTVGIVAFCLLLAIVIMAVPLRQSSTLTAVSLAIVLFPVICLVAHFMHRWLGVSIRFAAGFLRQLVPRR